MGNMEGLLELVKKQTELSRKFSGAFGMNDALKQLSENIGKSNAQYLGAFDSIAKMSRDISSQFTPNLGIPSSLSAFVKSQSLVDKFAFSGLEGSLTKFALQNSALSDKLTLAFQSQIGLSATLSALAKSISPPINQFNVLNAAIQGLSHDYLYRATRNSLLEDVEVLNDANEKLSTIAENVDANTLVDSDTLENLKNSIISSLTPLIQKSKSDRVRMFIMDLITIIGLILTIYEFNNSRTDLTNREVVEITSNEISQLRKDLELKMEDHFKILHKTRVALTNVNLRYSDKVNSKILGVVRKGQQVVVIEIRHKWLLITYLDDETKQPMSGFVHKKYFETEK